ncbi:hypothetical protein AB0I28_26710 [Phytomonospora sp. NPDC050363]|uniref:hypothetical protein n=1 Tax=Phytomonospora sp. NPDC050363 TaxID=3155642 RepID=UPI003409150E
MFAIIAAVLFGLALILDIANAGLGDVITAGTLVTAGLLFVALHLGAPLSGGRPWNRRGRR